MIGRLRLPLLAGYRVLDLADPRGYLCGKLLADLGAEVVKVEPPGGDPGRRLPPFKDDQPDPEGSLFFAFYSLSKKSLSLDLGTEQGRALFFELLPRFDVVLEAGELADLRARGLTYEALAARHPGVVHTTITPFGESGPRAEWRGPDIAVLALAGPLYMSGTPEGAPCTAPGQLAYSAAGAHAAYGTEMALYARSRTGRGQHVEVAAMDAAALLGDSTIVRYSYEGFVMGRYGNCYAWITPGSLYPARDGYVRIVSGQVVHWQRLVQWMGDPERLNDPMWENRDLRNQNRDLVDGMVGEFTSGFTKNELMVEGQRRGVPVTPVNDPAEFMASDYAARREIFAPLDHPVIGSTSYLRPSFRPAPGDTTLASGAMPLAASPLLGQHNAEILGAELGLAPEELEALYAAGVM